jgi:hypothetical protein
VKEEDIQEVLDKHQDELTSLPNVVGVGVVSPENDDPSHAAIAVYVSRKVPKEALSASSIVPSKLTATIHGVSVEVPTRVIEVGDIKLQ